MNLSIAQYLSEYQSIIRSDSGESVKVAILRSYSCDPLEQALTVDLYKMLNIRSSFFCGGFNQYAQEILNKNSDLYQYKPDYIFILVLLEDLCADVFNDYYKLDNLCDLVDNAVDGFIDLIFSLLKNTNSNIIIGNFTLPYNTQNISYHAQYKDGVGNITARANLRLVEKFPKTNAYILDVNEVIRQIGVEQAYDPKLFMIANNPYSFKTYAALSQNAASLISSILGRRKKCIVLDLDNTLWKGIIGEDGADGIEISEPYRQLQKQLLLWNNTGILLAICSKNNYDEALAVIRDHPDMILREVNFAALRIDWNNKADNLVSIAEELNIGIDSLIFIDDSSYECGLVAQSVPDVEVIRLDGDSASYADIIKNIRSLDFVRLTTTDRIRAVEYGAQRQRADLKARFTDIESYLQNLNMSVKIDFVNQFTISRAAQMTQKTNQFNLTTRRYTVEQLQQLLDKDFLIFTLESADRFGDNGIVGLIVLNTHSANADIWEIDTFLLSCRVIGREIERAFLSLVIEYARDRHVNKLIGQYIPSQKNKLVSDLYKKCGFIYEDGKWVFNVKQSISSPSFIQLHFQP